MGGDPLAGAAQVDTYITNFGGLDRRCVGYATMRILRTIGPR
jgi:hypothetical protein